MLLIVLVSAGVFKLFRVEGQKPYKAVYLNRTPTNGEKKGKINYRRFKEGMKKIKVYFDKYKGYILTIVLTILTGIEICDGFINSLFGGALTVNGVEILPIITLGLTSVVGILSNGFTKEEKEKVKALFSKSTTTELVKVEIKKTIKEKSEKLTQFNKIYSNQQHELDNLNSEYETLKNTSDAKREMFNMIPQLATNEDVQLSLNAVRDCRLKISDKEKELNETKKVIDTLTTEINALKSQL